jgi:hypothetical protein
VDRLGFWDVTKAEVENLLQNLLGPRLEKEI